MQRHRLTWGMLVGKMMLCSAISSGKFGLARRGQRLVWLVLVALASCFLLASRARAEEIAQPLITQAVDESRLFTLAGNTRPEARLKHDRGRVPDSLPMEHLFLLLKRSPQSERDLETLIDDLHNPSSPSFHKWLTAAEFGDHFGVAGEDREAIKTWLRLHGFKINVDYPSGILIDFSGTAGQVREAFHTEIHNLEVSGAKHIANMTDPQIPAALAPAIEGVVSLHDFQPRPMYKPHTEYTVSIDGTTNYLVVPGDLATIYNLNPLFSGGISGQGQTIVVLEDTDVYTTNDWTSFRSVFGLSSYTDGSFTQIHPAPPSGTNNCSDPGAITGIDLEAILDAEYASAVAPSAAIVLTSCQNNSSGFGGLIALENLLNQSGPPPAIVSLSYGQCESVNGAAANAAFNSTFQQAVAEGMSVFVAAGDHAAATCDEFETEAVYGIAISGFASSPYDVAVGGTDFGDTYAGTNGTYWTSSNSKTYESAKSYVPEIPWNDSCASQLLAEYNGFSQTYGISGFCNSSKGANFIDTIGGGGGPSECATGTPTGSYMEGGTCAGWPKPTYQSLFGNPADGVRDIPDISLFAADGLLLHSYPICFSGPDGVPCTEAPGKWITAGGTSFSAPIMAGIQALVNQKAGGPQGDPNYVYYELASTEYGKTGDKTCNSTLGKAAGSSCIFYDVTEGDNDVDCFSGDCYLPSGKYGVLSTSSSAYQPAFAATAGWDFSSGIGTVNAYNLVNNWPITPTYTISSNPIVLRLPQGAEVISTFDITHLNGFNSSVSLAASGLPSGVTAAFSPNPATSTSTLTLTASATAATGTATVTITGTSGSLSETTAISLTVTPPPTFALSAGPNSLKVVQGSQGTSTLTITAANGFTGSVNFSASGLPSGVTATFSPNPATSTSTLTLTASATAAVGSATVTITGISGSLTEGAVINLTVAAAPTFTLSASPNSMKVVQGGQGTSTLTITPANGFNSSVSFSASGLPSGVTATFSPNPATSTSTLTLTASSTAATGTATVTVTGTSGSLSETTTISLTVAPPPTFTLSASPNTLSVIQGSQGTSAITIAPANGFNSGVSFSASGLPSGVTATFSPNPATSTSTLTLMASATAATGTATVTVTGTSGSLSETTTISLTVAPPPTFALSASPSTLSVIQGSQGASTITIAPANGFTGSVSFSASGLPSGVTATFSPNPATSTSTLILTASATAATGTATVTVTGISGSLTETTTISLTVAPPPTFALSANPSTLKVIQGNQNTSTITITPANGFNSSVSFSASGLPSGVTALFSPNPATSTSTLTLTASVTAAVGSATVTVTGTSGSVSETTTISLTVAPPPTFALSANPSTLNVIQGSQGTSTLTITPANGFNSGVSLSASGLPSGVTATFSPNPATSTSTLTLTASATAATGTATVTVTGTSGSLSEITTISLTVAPPPTFTLSASPNTLSVIQGSQGTSTITIAPANGFNSSVSLAATGLPSGVTATFSPNPATSTSTLTLTASSTAATGTAMVTITGISGSLSEATTISLTVAPPPTFTLSASPNTLSVIQGSQGTSTIMIAPANGFTGSVSFSASGMPSGVTALFSPNPATSTSTLTLTASSTAATGTATVIITGTSGSLTGTTSLSLTVSAPAGFTISPSPNALKVFQGSQGASTITITPANGFNGSVNFSASGLPAGVTATFSPNPATSTSTLTLTTSATATAGSATVTITGTSGSLTETTTISLTVAAPPTFTLSTSPNTLTLFKGGQAANSITITPVNGFNGSVSFSASGLPTGVTAAFSPDPATSTSTLTLTASKTAKTGTATITIVGTSGTLTVQTTLKVQVPVPGFTLTASPTSLTLDLGSGGTSTITVVPTGGFQGPVTLNASGVPSGVYVLFSDNPTSSTSTMQFAATGAAPIGTYTVTITGTSGHLTSTVSVDLIIIQ